MGLCCVLVWLDRRAPVSPAYVLTDSWRSLGDRSNAILGGVAAGRPLQPWRVMGTAVTLAEALGSASNNAATVWSRGRGGAYSAVK